MIKFLTDGVLIREMMEDPLLTKYRYAHKIEAQSSSRSDFLLFLISIYIGTG